MRKVLSFAIILLVLFAPQGCKKELQKKYVFSSESSGCGYATFYKYTLDFSSALIIKVQADELKLKEGEQKALAVGSPAENAFTINLYDFEGVAAADFCAGEKAHENISGQWIAIAGKATIKAEEIMPVFNGRKEYILTLSLHHATLRNTTDGRTMALENINFNKVYCSWAIS